VHWLVHWLEHWLPIWRSHIAWSRSSISRPWPSASPFEKLWPMSLQGLLLPLPLLPLLQGLALSIPVSAACLLIGLAAICAGLAACMLFFSALLPLLLLRSLEPFETSGGGEREGKWPSRFKRDGNSRTTESLFQKRADSSAGFMVPIHSIAWLIAQMQMNSKSKNSAIETVYF
jgi:hypothetical protein